MSRRSAILVVLAVALLTAGCGRGRPDAPPALVGAWRSSVRFESGAFAGTEDLEFLYVFNAGGTMTESSNYDGAPPVPPAYGVWRSLGAGEFEARYEFFATAPPLTFDEIAGGSGWRPAGRGVLVERITVSPDAGTFTSRIRYQALDAEGKAAPGGGEATGSAVRIDFDE